MSTESAPMDDDNELRDMVANLLEKNGTLAKIRAQLRASVFLALDDKEDALKDQPLMNQNMKKFLDSEDGRLSMSLVWEFLEFFNLDYSLSVFSRESYGLGPVANDNNNGMSGGGILYKGREDLKSKLGLSASEAGEVPLLGELLKRLKSSKTPDVNPEKNDKPAASSAPQLSTLPKEPPKRVLGELPPLGPPRGHTLPPLSAASPGNAISAGKVLDVLTTPKNSSLGESKVFGDGEKGGQKKDENGSAVGVGKQEKDDSVENESSIAEEIEDDFSVSDLLNSVDGGDEELMTSDHTVSNSSGDGSGKFYGDYP